MRNTAWFVKQPRRLEDLKALHALSAEQPYEIVGEIELDWMDYENFIMDLRADRSYLEDWLLVTGKGSTMRCVLIYCDVRRDRILVVPKGQYVQYAAVLPM